MLNRGSKNAFLLLLAVLAIMVANPVIAGKTGAALTAENDLRNANDQEVAAFMARDAEALSQLWSDEFLVTNPLNKVASKAEVLAMVRNGMLWFKSYQRHIEHIRQYENTAVIIGNEDVEWAGKMPLAGRVLFLRFTAVWFHKEGHWVQIARHANVVPKT